jgi:predicted DNA repair protein MutK
MAGSSLFALIDDIATILDDVALMTKVAAKKTAGVLGDDLALNAQQVHGIRAERELPVVWAVAKGSMLNKAILVPSALLISALLPALIIPLLMIGGLYLCFEGVEKLVHKLLHLHEDSEQAQEALVDAFLDQDVDMVAFEKDKIKGAIRTDFILSAEIIVIALGTMAVGASLLQQALVLSIVAVVMTMGVYGIVAGIVKLDDAGFYLERKQSKALQAFGKVLIAAAPKLMRFLSVAGKIAMFLVGGGILVHGLHGLGIHSIPTWIEHVGRASGALKGVVEAILNGVFGVFAGAVVVAVVMFIQKIRGQAAH